MLSLSVAAPLAAQSAALPLGSLLGIAADAAASSIGAHVPLRFENLGLSPIALDLGFFTIKWYSLAYLVGIIFAYWHRLRSPHDNCRLSKLGFFAL